MTEPPPGASAPGTHVRGFLLLSGSQVAARLMTLASLTYLARVLQVEAFGAVGFAAVVVSYAMLLVDAGLDLVGMQRIATDRARAGAVVANLVVSRLALAVVALALLAAIAPSLSTAPSWRAIVLAQGLTMLTFAVNLRWALQAFEENGRVGISLVVVQALNLSGLTLLVHGPEHVVRVPLILAAADAAGALLLLLAYRRAGRAVWYAPAPSVAASLLRDASPLAGSRVLRAITINSDLLLLGMLGSPLAVGLYTAISRIVLALRELSDLYYVPLLPELARTAQGAGFGRRLERGLALAAAIVFPIAVLGGLRAEELLAFAFGPEYAEAAGPLRLLLVAAVFLMLGGAYRIGLVALGRQAALLPITAAGAALALGMNLVLVPRLSMLGGALSAAASELLVLLMAARALSRSAATAHVAPLLRPAAAAAGLAAVLLALPDLPFLATAAIGVASYGLLALATGALRPGGLAP